MTARQQEPHTTGHQGRTAPLWGVDSGMVFAVKRIIMGMGTFVRSRIRFGLDRSGPLSCTGWGVLSLGLMLLPSPLSAQDLGSPFSMWGPRTAESEKLGYTRFADDYPGLAGEAYEDPESAAEPYLDLDSYLSYGAMPAEQPTGWGWQILPDGLIYRPYLAGPKESRLSGQVVHRRDDGWLWEATLGQQVGLLRWGSQDPNFPVGFQLDVEGSAQVRLDIEDEVDVRSVDFRAGVPLTFGYGRHRTKLAYYHISSHLGDEFLLKNPDYPRLNFARDAFVLGHAIYLTPSQRVYAEAGWAFYTDVAKEWEFQFGYEFNPVHWMTRYGSPFFAVNGHLREELNFGGGLTVQTGWSWRVTSGRQLRMGMHYYNGKSPQYSFFNDHDQLIGFLVAFDR